MKKTIAAILMLTVMLMTPLMSGCKNSSSEPEPGSVEIVSDDSNEYPISEESMDMEGFLVRVNVDGGGVVARAEEGRSLAFDEEYPTTSTADNLKEGTKLIIEAKPDEGWKFVKWTLNGDDYSTDEQISYTVTEDAEFIAVFEGEQN